MAASALILFSLVNNNSANQMSHLFDVNYLKAQEKNKLLEIKKQRNQNSKCTELMFNNKSTKSRYYNHSNFNIAKQYKR
jgi:transposase